MLRAIWLIGLGDMQALVLIPAEICRFSGSWRRAYANCPCNLAEEETLPSQADGLCSEVDGSVCKIQELNWPWQSKSLFCFFLTPLPHFWWWTLWYHDHPTMLAAALTRVLTACIYLLQLHELNNPEGENESLY